MAFFPSSQESPYYQSEQFTAMLNFLRDHPDFSRMKEMNGKLSLTITKVKSINEAIDALLKISA
jgi:transcription-repair coupling factor (superfamily II helicase)